MVFHPPVAITAKAGDAGKYKVGLPAWNMVLRGFMSGAYIAMGAALATVCSTGIMASDAALRYGTASPGFAQLILGAVFPVGLIITVLTGAELFTGDAMLAPMAAFIHKVTWMQVINLWIFVYIGNFIGSVVFAYICANGPFVSFDAAGVGTVTAFGTRAIAIAAAKCSYVGMMGFYSAFLKGIACNWLVNLAILLGICADDAVGKFFGIWFPIMAFVSSGFEHSVANMYFIPAGIFTQGFITDPTKITASVNWVTMWTSNVIPVTIGNIVGGLFFVGIIYWVAFRKEIAALKQTNTLQFFSMKIGNVDVKISILSIGVFAVFTIILIVASVYSLDVRSQLIWLIPVLFMLLVLPIALNYMSRSQYAELRPEYEREAKTVRVKLINENMIGKIVRIEGVVERVHLQFLNRPQFTVADRSGAISVKMFTSPDEDIKVNDIVEVLGQVIRRYIVTGEPVINCVSIRKTDTKAR